MPPLTRLHTTHACNFYFEILKSNLKSNIAQGRISWVSPSIGQQKLGPLLCLISLDYWADSSTKHQSYKCLWSTFPLSTHGSFWLQVLLCVIKSVEICDISAIGTTVRQKMFPVSGNSTTAYLSQHSLGSEAIVKQTGAVCQRVILPNRWLYVKAAKRPCMSIMCLWGHELKPEMSIKNLP